MTKTLDQFLHGDKSIDDKITEAYKHRDEVLKDKDGQTDLYNNTIKPAHDNMVNIITKNLKSSGDDDKGGFGKDSDKILGKEMRLKSAVVDGLKEFFKKTQPGVLKPLEGEKDIEKLYKTLTNIYDGQILNLTQDDINQGIYGLSQIVNTAINKKDYTVGDLKLQIDQAAGGHKMKIMENYVSKKANMKFAGLDTHQIAKYVHNEIEGAGHKIKDKAGFFQYELGQLHQVRKAVFSGQEVKDRYNIELAKPKKK